MTTRDREKMRDFYDELAEGEWTRLEDTPRGRVAFEVHRRFLEPLVKSGDQVLEVGAGPGRFTLELARLGAVVDVTDYSPVQLALNRQHVAATSAESAVRSRELLDVCDASRYRDDCYDVVLAYGGALSYAFEESRSAFAGLLRVTKPGGYVVGSVMSWLGSWRFFLRGALEDMDAVGEDAYDLMMATGDLRHSQSKHVCQMFRARDVTDLIHACGGQVVAMSASNWASLEDPDVLAALETDPVRWASFLEHEVGACAEPGAWDGGTHVLFAAQRR